MPTTDPVEYRPAIRLRGADRSDTTDAVVAEEPLEIRIGDTAIAVIMRTPGDDTDLVTGFALTEGIALDPEEIDGVGDRGDGRFEILLADGVDVDPERFRRNLYATSSCGVCGKASIDALRVAARQAPSGPVVSAAVIASLPAALGESQPTFELTGGLHGAAAFTADGSRIASREDVGRHNAVDKLVGAIAAAGWPTPYPILFVSGRVSFEIVQKAAVAGFSVVAGVSAISSLAIDLAAELGLTAIGFAPAKAASTSTPAPRGSTSADRAR